jgi:hypothetical protein
MSDSNNTVTEQARAEGRSVKELAEEVSTKGLYIGVSALFLANAFGAFATTIPSFVFGLLLLVALVIDAYN